MSSAVNIAYDTFRFNFVTVENNSGIQNIRVTGIAGPQASEQRKKKNQQKKKKKKKKKEEDKASFRTAVRQMLVSQIPPLSSDLSLNHEGRWGTTADFATNFLHFSLFSTAL